MIQRLTDKELAVLPEEVQEGYYNVELLVDPDTRKTVEWVYREFAKALTPQPSCGHPRGCIVKSPYIDGVGESNHCGWCAEEMSHGVALVDLEECRKERDALREQLEKICQDHRRCIQWASEMKKVRKERDALREQLAAADGLCDALNWLVLIQHGGSRRCPCCQPSNKERGDALNAAKVAIGVWGKQ